MANPTTNYGWQMPTSSDLVTDLPADFEVFGQAVDTALADLKGGTSGQVLAKNSNTDMDFVWVAQDDSNAIQNAIVDAKGDLIAASAADTPARLAVGNNGETLVANSSTSTGLAWTANFAAGKNKIINGDFGIWQRGTSFTTAGAYCADRYITNTDATFTTSRQTFTPGTAPVAGYEGQYFLRVAKSAGGSYLELAQRIEDVRTFAGQTVTLSMWAKVSSGTASLEPYYVQDFGTGGSSAVGGAITAQTITTSWARYSFTFAVPSIAGKTIGTNSRLQLSVLRIITASAIDADIWGVQVEAGSVATAFQTATGTIQGELAACQRYYYRTTFDAAPSRLGVGYNDTTTTAVITIPFPVVLRTRPTALEQSGTAGDYSVVNAGPTVTLCSSIPIIDVANVFQSVVKLTVASGLTSGAGAFLRNVNTNAYLGWSAEL
jgi:predicted secreted protein